MGFKMRASSPFFKQTRPRPDYADPSKSAKKRIALAAGRLFMMYGIYVPLREIAQLAESNEATAILHYESHGGLVHAYVQDLIKEYEVHWKETEAEFPDDPEAQLRSWVKGIELRTGDAFAEVCQLPRVAAQLYRWGYSSPLVTQVQSVRIRGYRK